MSESGSTRNSLKRRMFSGESDGPVERDARAPPLAEAVEVLEVGHALDDREGLLVAGGEAAAEAVEQAVALDLAEPVAQTVTEPVGPVAADLDEPALEVGALLPRRGAGRARPPGPARRTAAATAPARSPGR